MKRETFVLRPVLFAGLLGFAWMPLVYAQTAEVPGMPADPTAAEPPPRIQSNPPEAAPQPPPDPAGDAETEADEAVSQPPVLPEPMESGEKIEPEVTIIKRDDATIEEYRHNGRLYMVKITPVVGKPYYLVDRDGDGQMEARMSEIYDDFVVPQWVILRW